MKERLIILALGLSLYPTTQASTVFNDTFEPDDAIAATRGDDPGVATDIQWRPRISSQASGYFMADDSVFGNALGFRQTANSLWIIGQFDNDASDGITAGSESTPVSLGLNLNDFIKLSLNIRIGTALSGTARLFQCGLLNVPGGPLATDPGTDSSWINPSTGYFLRMNEINLNTVSTFKQMGSLTVTPYQGAPVTISSLTTGIAGVTAAFGLNTESHEVVMRLTRVETGVQIDSYWDGTLVSTAIDDGSIGAGSFGGPGPYTDFNTIGILYGTGNVDYLLDNVKLEVSAVPEPGIATLAFLGLTFLRANKLRRSR